MDRFALNRRQLFGAAIAGIGYFAASAALAATTVTVWCWDPNFNGATMKEAGARYAK